MVDIDGKDGVQHAQAGQHNVAGVTVVASTCAYADALATAGMSFPDAKAAFHWLSQIVEEQTQSTLLPTLSAAVGEPGVVYCFLIYSRSEGLLVFDQHMMISTVTPAASPMLGVPTVTFSGQTEGDFEDEEQSQLLNHPHAAVAKEEEASVTSSLLSGSLFLLTTELPSENFDGRRSDVSSGPVCLMTTSVRGCSFQPHASPLLSVQFLVVER
jgi:hypothetical protein